MNHVDERASTPLCCFQSHLAPSPLGQTRGDKDRAPFSGVRHYDGVWRKGVTVMLNVHRSHIRLIRDGEWGGGKCGGGGRRGAGGGGGGVRGACRVTMNSSTLRSDP